MNKERYTFKKAGRLYQLLLVVSATYLSWLLMMIFHEAGHIAMASITGGEITRVRLHPFRISATTVNPNPYPVVVAWGGVTIGSIIPVILYFVSERLASTKAYLLRYIAGVCLLLNGMYLLSGLVTNVGDVGVLIGLGFGKLPILVSGLIGVTGGMYLLNNLGIHFGLNQMNGRVHRVDVILCFSGVGILVLLLLNLN